MTNNLFSDDSALDQLDDDPLWDLLDQGSVAAPSPQFASSVLNKVRSLEPSVSDATEPSKVVTGKFGSRWAFASVAGAAACLLAVLTLPGVFPSNQPEAISNATDLVERPLPAPPQIEDQALAVELLVSLTYDPELLTNREVVSLLF